MRSAVTKSISCISLAALTACSGGGGDGSQVVFFSGFSNLPQNGVTNFSGTARDATFGSLGGDRINTPGFSGSGDATASVVTQDGQLVAITVSSSRSDLSIDSRTTGSVDDFFFSSPEGAIAIVDPDLFGFEHQTFGAWIERDSLGGKLGVGSFGNRTPAGSVPSITATYNGASMGFAVELDGTWYATASGISITTDFTTASISSTGTEVVEIGSGTVYTAPDLDFSGTGPVSGVGFSAPVTGGLGLSGDANGQFYGPGAEEVGGTFSLSNSSGDVYGGAFGAKR